MIPYLIGAGIGFIVNEIINEDKIAKLKASKEQPAATPVETPTPEPPKEPEAATEGEGEEKEVKFVAKSRGKKK
jgi:hypothetical protein